MSNKTIEAVLRLSAKLGNMSAFNRISSQMTNLDKKAQRFNRSQALVAKGTREMNAAMLRYAAPTALAAGMTTAVTKFAAVERRLTRIGNVLDASRTEMRGMQTDVEQIAQRYALSTDAVMDTVDAYAAAGAELSDMRSDLDTLAKAQQAIDASGYDIVNVWDTARKSLDLAANDAERFFGIIAAGGAAGKFEGKDAAAYLPNVLPQLAAIGVKGNEAAVSVMGLLEVVRDFSGSSEQASTAVSDLLDKLSAPDVEKKFAKAGIGLREEIEKGLAAGEDLFAILNKILTKATGGDATKLSRFFAEKDSRRAARTILTDMDRILASQSEIRANAPDVLNKNNAAVLADAQTAIDRLTNSVKRLATSSGQTLVDAGAADVMDRFSNYLDRSSAVDRAIKSKPTMEKLRLYAYRSRAKDDALAWEGGYRTEEQQKMIKGYAAYAAEPALLGRTTKRVTTAGGVPLPNWRSDAGLDGLPSLRYPTAAPAVAWPKKPNAVSQEPFSGGATPREAERTSLDNLRANFTQVQAAIEDGGSEAGDRIATKITKAGDAAGDSIAAKIRGAISSASIMVRGSGPDIGNGGGGL